MFWSRSEGSRIHVDMMPKGSLERQREPFDGSSGWPLGPYQAANRAAQLHYYGDFGCGLSAGDVHVSPGSLESLAAGLDTDKGTVHSYLPYYDAIFRDYRERLRSGETMALLEIGVWSGGSIALWRRWFGPSLCLHCIDISLPRWLPPRTSLHVGSACDEFFVESNLSRSKFDIIIDDGSHRVQDQICAFNLLRPLLRRRGVYLIEDIQSVNYKDAIESETSTTFELVDLRSIKGRYDDILLVYRMPDVPVNEADEP